MNLTRIMWRSLSRFLAGDLRNRKSANKRKIDVKTILSLRSIRRETIDRKNKPNVLMGNRILLKRTLAVGYFLTISQAVLPRQNLWLRYSLYVWGQWTPTSTSTIACFLISPDSPSRLERSQSPQPLSSDQEEPSLSPPIDTHSRKVASSG